MKVVKTNILSALRAFVLMAGTYCATFAQENVVSPFMAPQNSQGVATVQANAANPLDHIDFDGYMTLGGKTMISIYDRQEQRSYWLTEGEFGGSGFSVSSFEPKSTGGGDVITLNKGGVSKRIQLKNSDIVTLKPTVSMAANSPAANVQRNVPARTSANMEKASDEEVRDRMKRVAEEIRRRRAMRRTTIQRGTNGTN